MYLIVCTFYVIISLHQEVVKSLNILTLFDINVLHSLLCADYMLH